MAIIFAGVAVARYRHQSKKTPHSTPRTNQMS